VKTTDRNADSVDTDADEVINIGLIEPRIPDKSYKLRNTHSLSNIPMLIELGIGRSWICFNERADSAYASAYTWSRLNPDTYNSEWIQAAHSEHFSPPIAIHSSGKYGHEYQGQRVDTIPPGIIHGSISSLGKSLERYT